MGETNALDLVVIPVYLVGLVGVGLWLGRWIRTGRDWLIAARRLPWPLVAGSLALTSWGAWSATGGFQLVYTGGVYGLLWLFLPGLGVLLATLAVSARWHRTRSLSPVEHTAARFGPATNQLLAWLTVLGSLVAAWFQLRALAYGLGHTLGEPAATALTLGVGLGATLLAAGGGLWALVLTDALQLPLLLALGAVVALVAPTLVEGGVGGLLDRVPPMMWHAPGPETPWNAYLLLGVALATPALWATASATRFYSVGGEGQARRAGLTASGLLILLPLLFGLPLLAARDLWWPPALPVAVDPTRHHPYLDLARQILPTGLSGLLPAVLAGLALSVTATLLHRAGAVLSRDLVKAAWLRDLDPRATLRAARVATLAGGILVTLGALAGGGVGAPPARTALEMLLLLQAPLSITILTGLVFRSVPARAGLPAVVWGLVAGWFAGQILQWHLSTRAALAMGCTLSVLVTARFLQGEYRYTRNLLRVRALVTVGTFLCLFWLGTIYQWLRWGAPQADLFPPWRWVAMVGMALAMGLALIPFCRHLQGEGGPELVIQQAFWERITTAQADGRTGGRHRRRAWTVPGVGALILGFLVLGQALLPGGYGEKGMGISLVVASIQIILGGVMLIASRRETGGNVVEDSPTPEA